MHFISKNNFTNENNDLIKKVQKYIRSNINQSRLIITKDERWKCVNINPTHNNQKPNKQHKEKSLIRFTVNWRNAPTYKLAKIISKKIRMYVPLPYTFNIKNSVHLMNHLLESSYVQ
jgi:hypothetical protein